MPLSQNNTRTGSKKLISIRGERVVVIEENHIDPNNGAEASTDRQELERDGGRCYEIPPWFLTQRARQGDGQILSVGKRGDPTITVIYQRNGNNNGSN